MGLFIWVWVGFWGLEVLGFSDLGFWGFYVCFLFKFVLLSLGLGLGLFGVVRGV